MIEKENKQIRVRIPDPTIWEKFIKHVKSKHGKTYGVIGSELQNAITQFLKHPEIINIKELKEKHQLKLQKLEQEIAKKTDQHEQLQTQHEKLRNKYDHLQERFNKSQKELNTLERENSGLRVVVAKVQKMSIIERILNRLPEEVKQLSSSEDK